MSLPNAARSGLVAATDGAISLHDADRLRIRGGGDRRSVLQITLDDTVMTAREGDSLASALLANGIRCLGHSFRGQQPRGAFCFMGICQECVVEVDGARVQACMTTVRAGMAVTRTRL
jgi:predicted molibdopterin-dependent oxidoreductase YjgC